MASFSKKENDFPKKKKKEARNFSTRKVGQQRKKKKFSDPSGPTALLVIGLLWDIVRMYALALVRTYT